MSGECSILTLITLRIKECPIDEPDSARFRAAEASIRRMARKNPRTNHRKIPEQVAEVFFKGGSQKKQLIKMYLQCGGDKDT